MGSFRIYVFGTSNLSFLLVQQELEKFFVALHILTHAPPLRLPPQSKQPTLSLKRSSLCPSSSTSLSCRSACCTLFWRSGPSRARGESSSLLSEGGRPRDLRPRRVENAKGCWLASKRPTSEMNLLATVPSRQESRAAVESESGFCL